MAFVGSLLGAPLLLSILTLVGTVAAVISTVAALRGRGLRVSAQTVRTGRFQPDTDHRGPRPDADPQQVDILFTLRGSSAIRTSDFDKPGNPGYPEEEKALAFDVGADIVRIVKCYTEPRGAPEPAFHFRGSTLFLPPTMINPGTQVRVSLLTENAPARPVTCIQAVIANVRVRSADEASAISRAYLLSLGGAVMILAALAAPLWAPALAARTAYRVAACLLCVITLVVIVAARIRKPRLAMVLSRTALAGLMGSIGWLAASPSRAVHGPRVVLPAHAVALHHPCRNTGGGDWVTNYQAGPNNNETVGYSSNAKHIFVNPHFPGENQAQRTQDNRVARDQKLVFEANARVDCAYQHDHRVGGHRQIVELAYFAGLTEGVDEDYDSGEAEELEGMLAAQYRSLSLSSGSLLKVVIANGGSKMQDAVPVARHLVSLAHRNRTLIGVVGMDRSTTKVQQAIRLFARNQLTVVATTLSADGIGQGAGRYYYQLAPSNRAEAALIRRYIQVVVRAYFEQLSYPSSGSPTAAKIVIEEPDRSPQDRYTFTLVRDLTTASWQPFGLPQPTLINKPGPDLCGDSVVDIYAGRHDKPVDQGQGQPYDNDFSSFLNYIANSCQGAQPFIIADDGVTRYVADPEARADSTSYGLTISYVTKGIAVLRTGKACLRKQTAAAYEGEFGAFCRTYADIAAKLRAQVRGLQFLWTGERVALAYDAANLFLTAVRYGGPLTHAQVPGQFRQDGEVKGVTGAVNYRVSNIGKSSPQGMPLAIVRLDLGHTNTAPTCAFPGQSGYLYGPGPGHGKCPNNQG